MWNKDLFAYFARQPFGRSVMARPIVIPKSLMPTQQLSLDYENLADEVLDAGTKSFKYLVVPVSGQAYAIHHNSLPQGSVAG